MADWLDQGDAKELLRLAPVEVFEAGPSVPITGALI